MPFVCGTLELMNSTRNGKLPPGKPSTFRTETCAHFKGKQYYRSCLTHFVFLIQLSPWLIILLQYPTLAQLGKELPHSKRFCLRPVKTGPIILDSVHRFQLFSNCNRFCFRHHVQGWKIVPTQLGPLERARLSRSGDWDYVSLTAPTKYEPRSSNSNAVQVIYKNN
jgi:hypothetical protein